jgi:histidyl-tRNA synthetase
MDYSVVKGTHDVIQGEASAYTHVENILCQVASNYGYQEFRTPIIENSGLFMRSVGEGSDIVRKEMYTFKDKGDRDITLRPEMTAGVVRSMVNARLFASSDFPVKAFYVGPNFRYERPQQGRYRQFNQFGVECVGTDSIIRDVEVIELAYNSLKIIGFDKVTLKINTLGDEDSRVAYKQALVDYFSKHIETMCDDCKERIKLNPLRILDCKVPEDQVIVKDAPELKNYLSKDAKERFDETLKMLEKLEIPFEIDENLVRGLDYYTGVVFEFTYVSTNGLNVGSLGGGGHYGKLLKELGGPDLEGVGFAFGIERLISILKDENRLPQEEGLDLYLMPLDKKYNENALELVTTLRNLGFSAEANFEGGSISSAFKKAERRSAKFALIFGEDEIKNNTVQVKDLNKKEQKEVKFDELFDFLDENLIDEDEHHHE